MAHMEPGDEFYPVRGDRPPDGALEGFQVWDPTNLLGFREHDEDFPRPNDDEVARRREAEGKILHENVDKFHRETALDAAEGAPLSDRERNALDEIEQGLRDS